MTDKKPRKRKKIVIPTVDMIFSELWDAAQDRSNPQYVKALTVCAEIVKLISKFNVHVHANLNAEQLLSANELRALALKARARELPVGFGHSPPEPSDDEPVADVLTNEEAPPNDEDDDPAE